MSIIANRPDEVSPDLQPAVSINNHYLAYESTPAGIAAQSVPRLPLRRAIVMAVAVVVVMLVVAVAATAAGSLRPAAAAESEVKIISVHYDLETEAPENTGGLQATAPSTPASYNSLVVAHRGVEAELEPLPGTVRVNLDQAQALDMAADIDGLRLGSAAPGFANELADAVSSAQVHRFVRFTPTAEGSPLAIDITYGRSLQAGDFLLVQERLGDAPLELSAINVDGVAIGNTIVVGAPYQWNTGHGSPPTEPAWVSVVAFERFATGAEQIVSLRVVGKEAEFKVLALGPAVPEATPPAPEPAAETVEAEAAPAEAVQPVEAAAIVEATEPPPFAAVGIEAGLKPAIAVGGEGCDSAADVESAITTAEATVGEAGTYCFTVTNLGTTHLTDVAISDPELGLSQANLPMLSGPQVLEPGQQAVFYHHGVVAEPAGQTTMVTATPTDATGTLIAAFQAPAEATGADGLPAQAALRSGPIEATVPLVLANVVEEPAAANEAPVAPITELALTGMVTEPWVLVIFAMAFIFIGYTAFLAFKEGEEANRADDKGHDQLDALGFD